MSSQHIQQDTKPVQAFTGAVALGGRATLDKGDGAGAALAGGVGGGDSDVMMALGLGAATTSGNAVTCTVPRLAGSRMAPMDTPLDEPPWSSPCRIPSKEIRFKLVASPLIRASSHTT